MNNDKLKSSMTCFWKCDIDDTTLPSISSPTMPEQGDYICSLKFTNLVHQADLLFRQIVNIWNEFRNLLIITFVLLLGFFLHTFRTPLTTSVNFNPLMLFMRDHFWLQWMCLHYISTFLIMKVLKIVGSSLTNVLGIIPPPRIVWD